MAIFQRKKGKKKRNNAKDLKRFFEAFKSDLKSFGNPKLVDLAFDGQNEIKYRFHTNLSRKTISRKMGNATVDDYLYLLRIIHKNYPEIKIRSGMMLL